MTQSHFMYELMKELDNIPDEEKYRIVKEYDSYFTDKATEGINEEDVILSLGSPKTVAEYYKDGKPIAPEDIASITDTGSKGESRLPNAVKFALLIPVLIIYEPIALAASVVLVVGALLLSLAAAAACGIAFSMSSLNVGFILFGIAGIFLTFSFVMLCCAAVKASARIICFLPRLMGSTLRGNDRRRLS